MIANVTRGSTFGALSSYLLQGRGHEREREGGLQDYLLGEAGSRDRVAWTSVRNLPVQDPELASAAMTATARQNDRVEKPVYHLSLSVAQNEELSREQWEQVADRVLDELGLREHQVLIVAHNDTAHHHVHLMVNRVHPDTLKAWDNSHDYHRIEKILRHLERDMELRRVPGHHYRLKGQERPEREGQETGGERMQRTRTGSPSWADEVRFKTYATLRGATSWRELEQGLAEHGLRLQRRGGGLVVTDGEHRVKASRLYRRASYRWLEARFGMSYEEWQTTARQRSRVPQPETRPAQPRDLDASKPPSTDRHAQQIRFRAYKALQRSTNWGELERGLAAQGLRLQRRGGGLVVTDGKHRVRASRIYRRGSYGWLEKRFGRSFERWRKDRRALLDAIDRYQETTRAHDHLVRQRKRSSRRWKDAEKLVRHRKEARQASQEAARRVNRALAQIYHPADLRSARRRIAAHARRHGWEATAQQLAKRPGRYGRLRSPVLSRTVRRKTRRHLLRRLVSAALDLSVGRTARLIAGGPGYRAVLTAQLAQRQTIRAQARLERLSPARRQREVAQRALALGFAAVRLTLAPQPLEVTRTALRTLQLARSIGDLARER